MRLIRQITLWGIAAAVLLFTGLSEAALKKGEAAPSFKELEAFQKRPMVILYFFRLDSKPSLEGLRHLKTLHEQYHKEGITILGIHPDAPKGLDALLKDDPLPFLIVKEGQKIFDSYQVKSVFPTTYILNAAGRISDVLEGGGPSSHRFMTTVAQRSLQMKKTDLAKKLFEAALKSNPKDAAAQSGLGHVYLKEGKLDRAEAEFSKIAQLKSPEAILGKEGLAEVHLRKGEPEKALAVAETAERDDPDSGLVHLVKGNILAGEGKQVEALAEFTRATEGKLSTDWQRAAAFNQAGRIHSEQGNYPMAERMYQEAVVHNPFSAEILTNRGVLYEKQGAPQKALALYQEALSVDPDDTISNALIKRIERHLAFKEDLERQKQVDALVAELTDRFQKGKSADLPAGDGWSSRPMTVAFLGLKSGEGALLREGMPDVLQQEISQRLLSMGRISVVEREIMEKLLTELKLGSSELADPETALKLGKLLSARLIVTGSLVQIQNGIGLSLRMIDPETSAIKVTYSDFLEAKTGESLSSAKNLMTLADQTARALGLKMKEHYPLKGRIASIESEEEVIVNLGRRHGMRQGTRLNIIAEGDPIVVDGKAIGHRKKKVGRLEIVEVEEGMSFGRLKERKGAVQKDQKVLEEGDAP